MSRSDNNGRGFRVEITLGSPVVEMDNSLYLDALIAALDGGNHHLDETRGVAMGSKLFFLDRYEITDELNPAKIQRRGFTRKPENELCSSEHLRSDGLLSDGVRIGSMRHRPSQSSGKLKAYGGEDTYITSRWYSHAVGWGVGDSNAVRGVLSALRNVGAKSRLGYGAVISVRVVDDQAGLQNWSLRVLADGDVLANSEHYAPLYSPLKGPYWDKTQEVKAQIYIGECPDFDLIS